MEMDVRTLGQYARIGDKKGKPTMKTNSNPDDLGRLIRQHRQAAGLSLEELANAAGMDRGTIHRMERGLITAPNPGSLQRLAQALGTDVSDYFAVVGYFTTHELPDLGPYLRAKFGATPEVAADVEAYFDWARQRSKPDPDDQAAA